MQDTLHVPILIVGDQGLDGIALEWALGQADIKSQVIRVDSCNEAVMALKDPNSVFFENLCVVLLDFDLPNMDGHKFLAEVKNDACMQDVIVFVFSASDDWINRMSVFDSQVAGFIAKSETNSKYRDFAEQLKRYFETTPLFAPETGASESTQIN